MSVIGFAAYQWYQKRVIMSFQQYLPANMKLRKTEPLASHSIDHRILAAGTFNDCQVPYFPGYIDDSEG